MKLQQRVLSVGIASILCLGVFAPMASANDHARTDATIALGAATVALFATNHRDAGVVGLGLTAIAAGLFDGRRDCRAWDHGWDHRYAVDYRHDARRDDRRDGHGWARDRHG